MLKRNKQYGSFDEKLTEDGDGIAHLVTESSIGTWAITVAFCTFRTDAKGKNYPTSLWQESVAKLHVPWALVTAIPAKTAAYIIRKLGAFNREGLSIYG